jgi:large subunit ribosomal protein L15
MKLHDLQPAEGSRKERIRVGRGIAAGKGKTAGRGTKGQKARAGGSIPPWFEGGQTPLHMRIPKLRGFKNRFRVEYEVVNVGAIDALVERGAFESAEAPATKGAKRGDKAAGGQITVNQDILRAVGLVRTLNKPLKILGAGELTVPLFVVADAFTASARTKIEAAGGVVNVLEMPTQPLAALGVDAAPAAEAEPKVKAKSKAAVEPDVESETESESSEAADEVPAAKPSKSRKAAPKAKSEADADAVEATAASEEAETAAPAGDDAPPVEPETTEPSADLNA